MQNSSYATSLQDSAPGQSLESRHHVVPHCQRRNSPRNGRDHQSQGKQNLRALGLGSCGKANL
eukprot:scaffold3036_cov414-Prasinococcus_capsulatus_cf.AAC.15